MLRAILIKPGPKRSKPIAGKVIQRGLGYITLIVSTEDGAGKVRRFEESKYVVTVYND